MRWSRLVALVCAAASAACSSSTEPVDIAFMHVQGRVFDADTGDGVSGAIIRLGRPTLFGNQSCCEVETGEDGTYDLLADLRVEWNGPVACTRGVFELQILIPDGYEPILDGERSDPLECTEEVQVRDIRFRAS